MNTLNRCMFTVEDLSYIPDKGTSPYLAIPEINITLQGVTNLLSSCDPHKSPGPDNLHTAFLKQVSMEIAPMLRHLFQQSLRYNSIPAVWKQAHVTPIYKKGKRSDPKNYQPVSLTSLTCKTMEHILVSQIMKHLESNNILIQKQHGFRSQHSCKAQLFLTTNDLPKEIDDKVQAILDFSKAFDKVVHNRLKHKLDFYGIRGNLLG